MTDMLPPAGYIPTYSKVEGIDVFMPAPPETDPHKEIVEFKCPQCGATTAYSASDGGLTCSHCGYYEAPHKAAVGKRATEFEFTIETMQRSAQGWGEGRKEMSCQNCGAQISIPLDHLTHTCAFCGSNKVIQRQAPQDILRPRFVIPFKIEPGACQGIVKGWLTSSWMTPSGLRDISNLANFTGIYLPYWTFDAVTTADWKAEVGRQETRRYFENGEWKARPVTVWRWESGRVRLEIDDLVVPGAARLSAVLMERIKDFDLRDLAPYEPKYLAGLQAQSFDIPLEKAWNQGRGQMREQTRLACLGQASTSQVRNFSMNLDFADESWRYILAPIYLAAYTYDRQPFQVMINGQTGEISGQRPVDWTKVWLVIALLLSPGLLLGLVGLITIPLGGIGIGIGGLGFILLIIGMVIGFILWRQADALDDV
ncbi:MAG: hypothetical protein JXA78_14630 [Anaerolineales bacterium]|nr:hypothetical protein [Anaerolineales bacterium]